MNTIDHTRMHAWSADAFRTAFLGKTATLDRPTAARYPGMHPATLANAQAGWDAANETDGKVAAVAAESDRKRAERRRAEAAEAERLRQRAEDAWLAPARAEYLRRGGTEDGWSRDRAAIADQARKQAAVGAVPPDTVRSLVNAQTI
jgi:hypothetical protein